MEKTITVKLNVQQPDSQISDSVLESVIKAKKFKDNLKANDVAIREARKKFVESHVNNINALIGALDLAVLSSDNYNTLIICNKETAKKGFKVILDDYHAIKIRIEFAFSKNTSSKCPYSNNIIHHLEMVNNPTLSQYIGQDFDDLKEFFNREYQLKTLVKMCQ